MRHASRPLSSGSSGARGGRVMMSASGRSKASASASVTAVTMFTHRICTGVIGIVRPNSTAQKTIAAWPMFVGRM